MKLADSTLDPQLFHMLNDKRLPPANNCSRELVEARQCFSIRTAVLLKAKHFVWNVPSVSFPHELTPLAWCSSSAITRVLKFLHIACRPSKHPFITKSNAYIIHTLQALDLLPHEAYFSQDACILHHCLPTVFRGVI